MDAEEKHCEMIKKGRRILCKPETGWLIDPNVNQEIKPVERSVNETDPYDFINTTPCHNFPPFVK